MAQLIAQVARLLKVLNQTPGQRELYIITAISSVLRAPLAYRDDWARCFYIGLGQPGDDQGWETAACCMLKQSCWSATRIVAKKENRREKRGRKEGRLRLEWSDIISDSINVTTLFEIYRISLTFLSDEPCPRAKCEHVRWKDRGFETLKLPLRSVVFSTWPSALSFSILSLSLMLTSRALPANHRADTNPCCM